jgi:hypothetical protein
MMVEGIERPIPKINPLIMVFKAKEGYERSILI